MATLSLRKSPATTRSRTATERLFGRDWKLGWAFLLPITIVMVGLIAYPFVSAVVLSLEHKVVGGPASFIGLRNYRDLLFGAQYKDVFRKSVQVSFLYTAVAVVIKLILGMCMALLLNEKFRGRMFMRAILLDRK